MIDDIVKRLRSPATVFYEYAADDGLLLKEAADALEAQANQITQLNRDSLMLADAMVDLTNRTNELRARIAELEAALKDCADELEAHLDHLYKKSDGSVISTCMFQYNRDIETVNRARAELEKSDIPTPPKEPTR